MTNVKIYRSESSDPYLNLAYEDYLLANIKENEVCFFYYINEPSVILGRFQNPWIECDINAIKRDGINLVRRQSGGGTVYHDLGNINFCFIHSTRDHKKKVNNEILIDAISSLDVLGYASERSDLRVDFNGDKKFSGSAFKQKKESSFHHGTLLINSNLDLLNNYLKNQHLVTESKSTKSVRSSVVNLSEISHKVTLESVTDELVKSVQSYYESSGKTITATNYCSEYLDKLKSWDWLMGETPKCVIKNKGGKYIESVQVRKGIIENIQCFENDVMPSVINFLNNKLTGVKLRLEDIQLVLVEINESLSMYNDINEELESFICGDLLGDK